MTELMVKQRIHLPDLKYVQAERMKRSGAQGNLSVQLQIVKMVPESKTRRIKQG